MHEQRRAVVEVDELVLAASRDVRDLSADDASLHGST
jgi:hypothetical protein